MDSAIESDGIGEGLVCEIASLEVAPGDLDVVEFRGSHPTVSQGSCSARAAPSCLADMNGTIIQHDDDRLGTGPG